MWKRRRLSVNEEGETAEEDDDDDFGSFGLPSVYII